MLREIKTELGFDLIELGHGTRLSLVPGISIPCGSGRDGLPVGLQIVAPRLHDRPLLKMAARAELALAR